MQPDYDYQWKKGQLLPRRQGSQQRQKHVFRFRWEALFFKSEQIYTKTKQATMMANFEYFTVNKINSATNQSVVCYGLYHEQYWDLIFQVSNIFLNLSILHLGKVLLSWNEHRRVILSKIILTNIPWRNVFNPEQESSFQIYLEGIYK